MQQLDGRIIYSASDLNNFLECEHLANLEREAARGLQTRPEQDELTRLIASKGEEHEARYLEELRARAEVCEIPRDFAAGINGLLAGEQATKDAIASGAEYIYQATFFDEYFLGHADFLRRVDRPSAGRAWSYEVMDTKLALTTKPYFLIQLCNYSEHLARLQGADPEFMHVVLGSGIERSFRVNEYAAYYRHIKSVFSKRMATSTNGTYPYEVKHCDICRWSRICSAKRDADDHLSLVANIRRAQIRDLEGDGIETLAGLAGARNDQRPTRLREVTFQKLRSQAALQHKQREAFSNGSLGQRYFYELLEFEAGRGFALLPQPDAGDLFFDMEGDPLYSPDHGLEYLFGVYVAVEDRYTAYWARDAADEQRAFEKFIDFLVQWRAAHPQMHVYHYAPYETTALKRLMGRYATREAELDGLLRAQTFVDLYAVVRQSLRISQPGYSIKDLEAFYDFHRDTRVKGGDDSILMFETWLALRDDAVLADIENYNRDDCVSTHKLRDWLLERRTELIASGANPDWKPDPQPPDESTAVEAAPHDDLRGRLLDGLAPPETLALFRDAAEPYRARWLLGHLLDYHRRDEKPAWWEYYHRCENRDQLIEFDRKAIGGLRLCDDVAPYKAKKGDRSLTYEYTFPEQEHDIGTRPYELNAVKPRPAGTIDEIDNDRNRLKIKLSQNIAPLSLDALAPEIPVFRTDALRGSLERIASDYLSGTLERSRPALIDLLLRRAPRLRDRNATSLIQPEHVSTKTVSPIVQALDDSYLFVQGPPGSGKSTIGAAVIVDLLAQGKKVAVLANAHKAIHNLVQKIEDEARNHGTRFVGFQKYTSDEHKYESVLSEPFVTAIKKTEDFGEPHDLAAGTAWLFSRPELADRYDYLFIDEAGQVSLANAIACAPCARNIVLLGDPLQLAQVSQGSHPIGVDQSVLEHLLGDDPTIPRDRGVFLEISYRMHPQICEFISRTVYGGRLQAAPETSENSVAAPSLSGSGLRFVPVAHSDNGRESAEEAQAIAAEFDNLVQGTYEFAGKPRGPLRPSDVLVVTPYNAQRKLITSELLKRGYRDVRVGTVDKFQGQEAPVVIYSMATSSGDDMPRDMAFLFESNRFNVAISRAQCLTILVCSPRLLEVRCKRPEQMALVNLLCAYAEAAT